MSVYVTDTHPLIWYACREHRRLSKKALRIFDRAWNSQAFIYVPAVALWEIAIIVRLGQVRLPTPFDSWAGALERQPGFDVAPLDLKVMAEFFRLRINGDPFDEAIVAPALVNDLPLITADVAIADSQVIEVVW